MYQDHNISTYTIAKDYETNLMSAQTYYKHLSLQMRNIILY